MELPMKKDGAVTDGLHYNREANKNTASV